MRKPKISNAVRRLGLATAICAGLVLGGCPSYRVTGVELVPGSTKPGAFSLGFRVEATVPKSAPDEEPPLPEGRGLIGVWLPEGWQATELRMKGPGQDVHAKLAQQPELSPALPKTFPYVPGAWWPFVTDCLEIGEGEHVYEFEVDASGPEDEPKTTVGIAIELFDAEVKVSAVDTEVAVDLALGTALEVVDPNRHGEAIKSSLDHCTEPDTERDPGEEEDPCGCPRCPAQVDRGKRGCSCDTIGGADPTRGLVDLIVSAFC